MTQRSINTFFMGAGLWICLSCSTAPQTTPWVWPELPEGVGVPAVPERNPMTVEGVALGRKLFFDQGLSQPRGVSCMSCHMPGMAFTDGFAVSRAGVSGKPLLRNSPTLINLAWGEGFFWDGGATNLESQAYGPLQHPDEMNNGDLKRLETYLRQHPEYPALFQAAFGPEAQVDNVEVVRALAQYQRTLVSFNTPWDRHQAGEEGALSELALRGWEIFQQQCSACHTPPLFTDQGYHNNGLDAAFPANHEQVRMGRYRITLDSADLGKFKTPTLRNIARTDPYMHDGRFDALEEVLDHYAHGIQPSATLDSALAGGLTFSDEERAALLAFLREGLKDEELPH
ncbi:MAG TPA: cytochrome-c peroxidase [Cytophagales bacterium]|nr:cytochrome-c peroxidase [Cytophagales bacterium]